jgi:predicted metalloendopeptidase
VFRIAVTAILCAFALSAQTPPASRPNSLHFDINAIDKSADPCVDFYQYACGTWVKNNPIPADQSRWGRFSQLQERNRDVLHDILEAAAKPDPNRDPSPARSATITPLAWRKKPSTPAASMPSSRSSTASAT